MEKKRRKIVKGKVKNYYYFFFFFFFFFAFHFSKRLKFVLGLPKWKFSIGKKHFTPGEKNQEKWLCPLRKIFLLRPWRWRHFVRRFCSWNNYLTLVLRRGFATNPQTVFAKVLKNTQLRGKIAPSPLSSSFPLTLAEKKTNTENPEWIIWLIWVIVCHYTDKKTHFSHIFESFCPCTDPLWLKWVKWFTWVFLWTYHLPRG